jgi:hypothetical protein
MRLQQEKTWNLISAEMKLDGTNNSSRITQVITATQAHQAWASAEILIWGTKCFTLLEIVKINTFLHRMTIQKEHEY